MRVFLSDDLERAKALSFENMKKDSSDIGFEYKGQWITNPFLDASGRHELSPARMRHYYGEKNVQEFLEKILSDDTKNPVRKQIIIDSSNVDAFAEEMFRFNCAHEYNSMCFSAGDVAREQAAKHETDMIIEKMAAAGFNVHEIKAFKDHDWKVDDLAVTPVEEPVLIVNSSLYENYFDSRGIKNFYTENTSGREMTAQEAIDVLKENQLEHYYIDIDEYKEIDISVRNMAIQALEEVQRYRALGITPERVEELLKCSSADNTPSKQFVEGMTNLEFAKTLDAEQFDKWVHKQFYGRCNESREYQEEQRKKGYCNGSEGCKRCNVAWLNETVRP